MDQIMLANLKDEAQSWFLNAGGAYSRARTGKSDTPFSAHDYFMTNPSLSGRGRRAKDRPKAIRYDRTR